MDLASPYNSISSFQRLLFLRCLRPDKVIVGIQAFVMENMGQRFVEAPPFDLATCYKESDVATPLIFVLSMGADPMADLLKLAEQMKTSKKFEKVRRSLQGSVPRACVTLGT